MFCIRKEHQRNLNILNESFLAFIANHAEVLLSQDANQTIIFALE